MDNLKNLEQEIEKIKARNAKVEDDKNLLNLQL